LQNLLEALEKARTVYGHLEYQVNKEQAGLRLSRAVAADSIADIESSISEAIECEVDPANILTANERIAFLAERARASAELTVAMDGQDLIFLQWAIKTAESRIADETLLADARARFANLAEEARKDEMFKIRNASLLRSAVFRSGKSALESVDLASHEVRDAGFGMRLVSPSGAGAGTGSRRDTGPASKRFAARKTLLSAVASMPEKLGPAVREGAQAGLPVSELGTAFRTDRLAATRGLRSTLIDRREAEKQFQLTPLMSSGSTTFLSSEKQFQSSHFSIGLDNTVQIGTAPVQEWEWPETPTDEIPGKRKSSKNSGTMQKKEGSAVGLRPERTIDPRVSQAASTNKAEAVSTGSRTCSLM